MQHTIETANPVQGAKGAKTRKSILITDQASKATDYLRKVTRFSNNALKFKPVFEEIATENLVIPYSKEWLKAAVVGTFEQKIEAELDAFLLKQPKLMRKAIMEEWYRISPPLFTAVLSVRQVFEEIHYESASMGTTHPAELTSFDSMPIDVQGNFDLSEEWTATIKKAYEVWIDTEQTFVKYDLIKALDAMKLDFQQVYGDAAGFYWTQLTQNFNPTSPEFLIHCIK